MSSWNIPSWLSSWISGLSNLIDRRLRPMFLLVFCGLLLTRERRRTCTSWFRAGGITDEFQRGYRVVGSTGRNSAALGMSILFDIANSPAAAKCKRIKLTLDDTPSQRYGPQVKGAGLHHNPTPGPSNQPFLYGDWAAKLLSHKGKPIWLAVDGGYANRAVIQAAKQRSITLVGRLRKNAALTSLPEPQPAGKRGRKPKYGKEVISLAKRAGHREGWQQEEMVLYGVTVTKRYKTFLATWRPAGGMIRVVLVKEDDSWLAFFCTDAEATAAEILSMVADRNSLEQTFKDVKEVWGAGQQQVRNIHASIGAWHLNLWAYTLVELWAWQRPEEELVDRSCCPWDSEPRRPSHADRRKALLRHCLQEEFREAQRGGGQKQKLVDFAERLIALAV